MYFFTHKTCSFVHGDVLGTAWENASVLLKGISMKKGGSKSRSVGLTVQKRAQNDPDHEADLRTCAKEDGAEPRTRQAICLLGSIFSYQETPRLVRIDGKWIWYDCINVVDMILPKSLGVNEIILQSIGNIVATSNDPQRPFVSAQKLERTWADQTGSIHKETPHLMRLRQCRGYDFADISGRWMKLFHNQ